MKSTANSPTRSANRDRLVTEPKREFDNDQDRALLLRLPACGGDRRAVVCGRVSLHGMPTPYWLAPFGVGTLFSKEQVRAEGPSKVYVRGTDSGRKIEIHFCPDCGSSVFWYAELYPDFVGIAFGTFADPSMPSPTLSVWEATRHPWLTLDHQLDRFRVEPEIDDRDLERLTHGGANDRSSMA